MKICLIASSFPRFTGDHWGSFVLELAQYLTQRGHEVHVVTPLHPGAAENETWAGIVVHRFRHYGWQRGLVLAQLKGVPLLLMASYVLAAAQTAARVVRAHHLDIIHAYWVVPGGFIGLLAGWLTGAPVVASAPGSDLNIWPQRWLPRQVVRFTLRRLDGVFTLGAALGEAAIRLGADPARVTVNLGDGGMNLDLLRPPGQRTETRLSLGVSEDTPLILFVGRLRAPKRLDHLLRAIHRVTPALPTVRLCIVGDGPDEALVRRSITDLQLDRQVFLLGSRPHADVPALLEAADLFIYPSDSEGLPSAIMEALAMGVPVIASRVGGIPDLVTPGETGFLVEPGDIDGLTRSILTILTDPDLAHRLGAHGRFFAQTQLDKEVIMPRIEKGYETALKGRHGTSE